MKNKTIYLILTIVITALASSAYSAENLDTKLFDNCQKIESVSNVDLEDTLKSADTSLKTLLININKDSKEIDKHSGTLADSLSKLHDFMGQQNDLSKNKTSIKAKKDETSKKNTELLKNLDKIKDVFNNTQNDLGQAYCSVVGLHDYFADKSGTTDDKEIQTALGTSFEQLSAKKEKLDKILNDFDIFWGHLNSYIKNIEDTSDYLEEFMNSVIAYENHTCQSMKKEGQPCPFKSGDIQALLSKQKFLLDTNKTFLLAKKELIEKSAGWGDLNEKTK